MSHLSGYGLTDPRFTTLMLNTLRRRSRIRPGAHDVAKAMVGKPLPRQYDYSQIPTPQNAGGVTSALSGYGFGAFGITAFCQEFDIALDRLKEAIAQAEKAGVTGSALTAAKALYKRETSFWTGNAVAIGSKCDSLVREANLAITALEKEIAARGKTFDDPSPFFNPSQPGPLDKLGSLAKTAIIAGAVVGGALLVGSIVLGGALRFAR